MLENVLEIKSKKTILILNSDKKILIKNILFNYLKKERYHCDTTIIIKVSTNGKAGYRVWKSAGGQGDHDMSLPWVCLLEFDFFAFDVTKLSFANPLFIILIKKYILMVI